MKKKEFKFWEPYHLLIYNADYYLVIGERSNGKTTGVLGLFLEEFCNSKYTKQCAIIRRYDEDLKSNKAKQLFEGVVSLGWVKKYSKGEFNTIYFYGGQWFLAFYNDKGEKEKVCETPFAFAFSISGADHFKSISFPNIYNILFDEFLSRDFYMVNEFVEFQNLLSTIIRLKDGVKIFMCGNTVNKYSPYFTEMGLKNIKKMKEGTIDVYSYGNTDLKVVVEYCSSSKNTNKKSNKYFAFDNPRLQMIKEGSWEIDIYPHLPFKYIPKDVIFKYYIEFDTEKFECEVIMKNESLFTFIHRKTTPIIELNYPVYSTQILARYNYSANILYPRNEVEKFILLQFRDKKVFYQDNEVGESIRNFLMYCQKNK